MTTRTWVGGGTNLATNRSAWSPTGVPRPGDQLTMTAGTMNIVGNALAGDPLAVPTGSVDLNLTNASLNLLLGTTGVPQIPASAAINMSGSNTVTYTGADSTGTVNLAAGAQWTGQFSLNYGYVTNPVPGSDLIINGQAGSAFVNTGTSQVGDLVQINANVTGTGNFLFGYNGVLEFMHSVGPGQSVSFPRDSGTIQIDNPTQFQGLITLSPPPSLFFANNMIDLKQLAMADSYSYANDLLSIFSGGKVIDTLRLVNKTGSSVRLIQSTSDLYVLGASDMNQPQGKILPLHP